MAFGMVKTVAPLFGKTCPFTVRATPVPMMRFINTGAIVVALTCFRRYVNNRNCCCAARACCACICCCCNCCGVTTATPSMRMNSPVCENLRPFDSARPFTTSINSSCVTAFDMRSVTRFCGRLLKVMLRLPASATADNTTRMS